MPDGFCPAEPDLPGDPSSGDLFRASRVERDLQPRRFRSTRKLAQVIGERQHVLGPSRKLQFGALAELRQLRMHLAKPSLRMKLFDGPGFLECRDSVRARKRSEARCRPAAGFNDHHRVAE